MSQIVGIILAGGQSVRMGSDKALLGVDGETLLDKARNYLSECNVTDILVSGHKAVGDIPDLIEQGGPVAGILASLQYVDNKNVSGLIFVPLDMPMLRADIVNRLLIQGQLHKQVCCYHNHFLPLYVPVNSKAVIAAQYTLDEANGSIKTFVNKSSGVTLALPKGDFFININTPSDWEQFKRQTFQSEGT